MNAHETEVLDVTASATSYDIHSDKDTTSVSEDNSDDDSTILNEPTLDVHDIPRSGLISPLVFSSFLVHRTHISSSGSDLDRPSQIC